MRWAAALLVFGLHIDLFRYFGGPSGTFVTWAFAAGDTGVSFFFVLSGFVLMWSARSGDTPARFWRRRIARVYPVHLATALLALAMAYTIGPLPRPTGAETAANLLLVQSWKAAWWQTLDPVSWSLACEAFFYALFPAVAWMVRRCTATTAGVLAAVCAAAVAAMPWLNQHAHLGWQVYSFPIARLPEFLLGAALARLVMLDRWRGPGPQASLGIAVAGYFLARHLGDFAHQTAATLIGYALLIPAAARADLTAEPSMWRHRTVVRLGELSFAFYMVHLLVLLTGRHLLPANPHLPLLPALGTGCAALAVSLAAAWALHEGIERPARRLLLRAWREKPAADAAEDALTAPVAKDP